MAQAPVLKPEVALPPAQVGLPSLGLAGEDAFSQRDERTLGMLLWREVRNDAAFVQDPLVTAYLQRLVNGLAKGLALNEQGEFKVFAVADSQLNAFAMPGRLLGVHSGLMLGVAREGELAAVLAHEIGHISQRHFARRVADQKNNAWIGWAGMAAAVLAARNTSNASSGSLFEGALLGSQALLVNKQLGFSRDMEREADAVGLQLLQTASYDGADMVRMLRRLAAGASLNDTGTGYARSHPGTTERMANVEGRLRNASTQPAAPDTGLDFLLAQARLRAVTATSGDDRSSAEYFFEQAFMSKDGNTRRAAAYGLAVLYQTHQAPAKALHALNAVNAPSAHGSTSASEHPWVAALRLALEAPLAAPASASSAPFASPALSVQNHPELAHDQAQAARRNAQSQGAAGVLSAAEGALKNQLRIMPYSDLAWEDLASIYAAQNRPAEAAYAQAERMAVQGAWASGLSFLDQAIKLARQTGQVDLETAWVKRELALKSQLADERAFEQKQK